MFDGLESRAQVASYGLCEASANAPTVDETLAVITSDQQRAESVVLYAPGAEAEAKDVGRRMKIAQREPIDVNSQARAGDAAVVVVAGADLNP